MKAYEDLRESLQNKMTYDHDSRLEEYIRENSRDHKLITYLDDYSLGEFKLEEDSILVEIGGMDFGEPQMEEAGDYQDENGDSYDIPETVILISVHIDSNGISWEKM